MAECSQGARMVYDPEELTQLARTGSDMPTGLGFAEIWLFQAMRNLYSEFRRGRISQEAGKRERVQIMNNYRSASLMQEVWRGSLERIKRGELAVSEYRKNPTIENADKAIDILYGGVERKQNV